jgi:hypothetical protein
MSAEIIPDLPAQDYHEDQVADGPTLSASIAHKLVTQSPLHAWTAHPVLNPNFERKEDEKFDVGTVCHALLLEGVDRAFVVHGYDDWKKADARAERDDARARGFIPMLAHQREEVDAMLGAIRVQLAVHQADPPLFQDGAAEQTLVWDEDGGVKCRARLDWLRNDLACIDDLKTRSQEGGASEERWKKALYSHGAHLQAYMYLRGVERLTGRTPTFRWCCVETQPPYALAVYEPDASILAVGQSDFEYALGVWRKCLADDSWPAYPPVVTRLDAPSWEVERRVVREEMAA